MNFLPHIWTRNTNELNKQQRFFQSAFQTQFIQACAFADCMLGLSGTTWQEAKAQPTSPLTKRKISWRAAAEREDSDTR